MAGKKNKNRPAASKMSGTTTAAKAKGSPASCSRCPCTRFMVLLLIFASTWVVYDVQKHGSWDNSLTSNALNSSGIYTYTNVALGHAQQGKVWVTSRIEEQFPGFTEKAHEFSKPYLQLCCDLRKVACNVLRNVKEIVLEKYPVVVEKINEYAPGAIESSQKAVQYVANTCTEYSTKAVRYIKEDVFVGRLSPENIQKTLVVTFQSTVDSLRDLYYFVKEKIETAMK